MAIDLSEEQLRKVGTTAKKVKEAVKVEPESVGEKILDFFVNLPKAIENVGGILKDAKEIRNPTPKKTEYTRPTTSEDLQGFDKGRNVPQEQIEVLNLEVKVDNIIANIFNQAETQATTLKAMSGYQFLTFLKQNKDKLKAEMLNELRK